MLLVAAIGGLWAAITSKQTKEDTKKAILPLADAVAEVQTNLIRVGGDVYKVGERVDGQVARLVQTVAEEMFAKGQIAEADAERMRQTLLPNVIVDRPPPQEKLTPTLPPLIVPAIQSPSLAPTNPNPVPHDKRAPTDAPPEPDVLLKQRPGDGT